MQFIEPLPYRVHGMHFQAFAESRLVTDQSFQFRSQSIRQNVGECCQQHPGIGICPCEEYGPVERNDGLPRARRTGNPSGAAIIQNLYVQKKTGFEATVDTMNTRAATLFEGIANNAILIAHGVTGVDEAADEDLQIGVLLALLQDNAKNQFLSHLGRGPRAAGSRCHVAPRFSRYRRACQQALRRMGKAPASGPHVSARLPRRHRQSRRPAPQASGSPSASGALRMQRPRETSKPSIKC